MATVDLEPGSSEVALQTGSRSDSSLRLMFQKELLAVLMVLAVWALGGLLSTLWNQAASKESRIILLVGFSLMFWLPLFQIGMAWYLSLRFKVRDAVPAPPGLSVDVFVTTLDEPLQMVESSLAAAANMSYPHKTYVLDDGHRPEVRALAKRLGIDYLTRTDRRMRKAGNINHALKCTSGEFVVIFDVDHHPHPDFLDRSLGFFSDPDIGFVQVMNTFANAGESLVARASCETAYQFYNIGAVGKDRCAAASLMGSNAVIRRRALEASGYYRPGLAEDLETSLALHSQGWKSAYVREVLAPGHAPSDLMAFFKQQLKWSNGVFTAALNSLRSTFWRLDPQQRLCYLTRFTYYLNGALAPLHIMVIAFLMVWPVFDIEMFSRRILPFTLLTWLSAGILPLRMWALEPAARRGLLFRGSSLFLVTWPFYTAAAVAALVGRKLPFVATPKVASSELPVWAVAPQISGFLLLLCAVGWRLINWSYAPMPVTVVLASITLLSHWVLFVVMAQSWGRGSGSEIDEGSNTERTRNS